MCLEITEVLSFNTNAMILISYAHKKAHHNDLQLFYLLHMSIKVILTTFLPVFSSLTLQPKLLKLKFGILD